MSEELKDCPICNSPTRWCCGDDCHYIKCTGLCKGSFDMSDAVNIEVDSFDELRALCAEKFNTRANDKE